MSNNIEQAVFATLLYVVIFYFLCSAVFPAVKRVQVPPATETVKTEQAPLTVEAVDAIPEAVPPTIEIVKTEQVPTTIKAVDAIPDMVITFSTQIDKKNLAPIFQDVPGRKRNRVKSRMSSFIREIAALDSSTVSS